MNAWKYLIIGVFTSIGQFATGQSSPPFSIRAEEPVTIACNEVEEPVVKTALELLERDLRQVFSASTHIDSRQGTIIIGTVNLSPLVTDIPTLKGKKQAFLLKVLSDGKLLIAGSDPHGTAYGIMELSRLIGVSPWEWWADVSPKKKDIFELPAGYQTVQSPSVEYRGIFINDEDWGIMPWSYQTYEPSDERGHIGPNTHARIFELLLRLRANTYWPAMHECTLPFFLTKGNREVAKKFGIYIGSSHCEPMACNAAGEWSRRRKGEYDYVNNNDAVYHFWEERVKEVAGQEILYTLGMRGVHDGQMQGAATMEEQKAVLERVLKDQRGLLQKYVNKKVDAVPQVFIPYKEILSVYRAGLEVPDDVTLMWCDDNYGYIRHFPDEEERKRKGGNGIYYHISYWGRPHDYLWLGTFSPALLYQQMKQAYDYGIRKIWVLNVGDIKPAEYQIELFMDMAWNIDEVEETGITRHLAKFLEREFGTVGERLLPVMQEHYRLAYIRKPEFMGNTRTEEELPIYRIVKDLPWSEPEINKRLTAYEHLSELAEALEPEISSDRKSAYFELVKYPVQAATQMNKKLLSAQLARHGKADWNQSDAAFDSIANLTRQYNTLENGKWMHMMDFQPRKLPVFNRVERRLPIDSMLVEHPAVYVWNGMDCTSENALACEGLGYEGKAAAIEKGESLVFEFDDWKTDSIEVEICLLPNHPIEGGHLRFTVSVGETEKIISYATEGRSEEWKENVLRNQAIRKVSFPMQESSNHRLTIKALDEGVVLDQIKLYDLKN
ncbi:glycosyl hydrolase 115 family protein [Bacteroides sp.]